MTAESSGGPVAAGSCPGLMLGPLAGLFLGLIAGVLTWAIIQGTHPVFRVDKKFDVPSIGLPPELFAAHRREQDRVDRLNAGVYVGVLGMLLGNFLALGEAIRRRSALPFIAVPLGAAGGALGGWLAPRVFEYVRAHVGQAELVHTVAAQLLVGLPLGLGVGLGLGLAARTAGGAAKAALAGLAAGLLAAIVYPVAVSILLPAASSDALLPDEATSRLLWLTMVSGTIGLIVPIAGRQRRHAAPTAESRIAAEG